MIYGNKLRSLLRIKIFAQGEGTVNSLGGLRPDTVQANITGNLRSFWKILNDDGYILNWSGEVRFIKNKSLDEYEAIGPMLVITLVYEGGGAIECFTSSGLSMIFLSL